ncbi:sulfite exporter TauE/SafE family protein [Deinococcus knuensis]|uniref:Probable membrane transporter protein n=1 Tax=Deinococcus knuensis TaxID=1837380 RepID=A0ABQ2SR36_9DEIO|nr:sulfite exporter TauE/SafE family protein [Deinococcus knuensis]GGS37413.1 UPF0721 transmembrane protein [Deinococcus knuensis]
MSMALIGAVLIGLSLGLLGSGGSILTVPVLVYLAGEPEKLAVTESLAIVGLISLFSAVPYALRRAIDVRRVLLFGLPGMLGTALGTALSAHLSGAAQLTLFAAVMLLSATLMFRPPPTRTDQPSGSQSSGEQSSGEQFPLMTAAQGLGVGVLTGVVGVGGGFLIIPALVLLGGLPMNLAVGTSLVIITMNSATGFARHLSLPGTAEQLHWPLILTFGLIGVGGSLLGSRLNGRVSNVALRRGFAAFLVVMGSYVLATNAPRVLHPAPPQAAVLGR